MKIQEQRLANRIAPDVLKLLKALHAPAEIATFWRLFSALAWRRPNLHKVIMNKYIPIIASVALFSGPISCQLPQSSGLPFPSAFGPPCKLSSRDVDVYGFYGSKEIVTERVANLPVDLSKRRLFLQITQAGREDGAKTNVKLFEKQKDGTFAVTEWTKEKTPGLFAEVDRAIIENKGMHCVGDAIKDVLAEKLGPGKAAPSLPASGSSKEAFAPSVQDAPGDFIKSVVILGC